MDFRFDEDEREIIEQAARTLARDLPAKRLLEGGDRAGWLAVGADGWLQAGLEEERGGAELPLSVLAGIGRGAGRTLAGDGFVANGVFLPELVARAGDERLLEEMVEHPGFLLADGRAGLRCAAGGAVTEWCFGVEAGLDAYRIADGKLLRHGPEDWSFEPLAALALGVGTVTIREGADPEAEVPLVGDLDELAARASIVHSASLVGLGDQALADTVEYVGQREQFGGPIGRFQAVKHGLADVSVALEIAWGAVLYAALAPDPVTVAVARLQAVEAVDAAVRAMVQFFGGIAMTWEHHAHLYVKTALAGVHRFGSVDDHARLVAARLLKGVES